MEYIISNRIYLCLCYGLYITFNYGINQIDFILIE